MRVEVHKQMRRIVFVFLSVVLVLAGCNDHDRSDLDKDSPAAGIYSAREGSTFFPQSAGPVVVGNVDAIIGPTGEAWLIMRDGPWSDGVIPQALPFQVSGPVGVNDDKFNASLNIYPDGKIDPLALIAEGTIVPRVKISTEYTWGNEVGSFWLNYSELNQGVPGMDKLEGIWSVTYADLDLGGIPTVFVVTITVYADGTAFGSDTSGCTYSGTFTIPNPQYNMYGLLLELTSCGSRDGDYEGLAYIGPAPLPELSWRTLYFGTSSNERSFNARLAGPRYP